MHTPDLDVFDIIDNLSIGFETVSANLGQLMGPVRKLLMKADWLMSTLTAKRNDFNGFPMALPTVGDEHRLEERCMCKPTVAVSV